MAEKISTLILKVDLDCHLCYKKIRKILCKLQDKEKIRTISYDEKNKTIMISGPFDPQKLSDKLRCKGGKMIKDIQIKEDKPKDAKPAPVEKEKPKPAEKEKPKEKTAEPAAPVEKEKPKEKPAPAEKEKPADPAPAKKEKPKEKPPESAKKPEEPKKPEPVELGTIAEIPAWPTGPCYQGYYGGCGCYNCGRAYGWVGGPPPAGYYGGPAYYDGYKGCHFFSEEDPSTTCSIM